MYSVINHVDLKDNGKSINPRLNSKLGIYAALGLGTFFFFL